MSNARIRKRIETMSAPVVAWLIDHGYVDDDCGILNIPGSSYNLGQGMLQASRTLQVGVKQVPVPAMRERL